MTDDLHLDPVCACLDPTKLPKISFSILTHIKRAYVWLKTCRFVDVIHHRPAVKVSPVQPLNLIFISSSVSSSCKMSVHVSIPVSLSVCLGQALFMPSHSLSPLPFFPFLSLGFSPLQSSKSLPCWGEQSSCTNIHKRPYIGSRR